ncbi:MAG: hypothetical protein AB8E82_00520 [Aureispira sp.]
MKHPQTIKSLLLGFLCYLGSCNYLLTTEMNPASYFSTKKPLLLTTTTGVVLDTLAADDERYQELLTWLRVHDKWKSGKQYSSKDMIYQQKKASFALRFSEEGSYVSVEGLFDRVSDGNDAIVFYYQTIEKGSLDFLRPK